MLHVINRAYGGENKKGRPDYYSKQLAVASLIRAVQELPPGSAEIIFLCDGPIPSGRLVLMEGAGEVLPRSNMGLRGSLRAALALPADRKWAPDDLIWLAEDDYLYKPNAFVNLVAAAAAFPEVDYFALYAQVGDRPPSGNYSRQGWVPPGWRGSEVRRVQGHPWTKGLATTSTFGARVKPLLEDRGMMHIAMYAGGAWDHTTHLMLQGFSPFPVASLLELVGQAKDWKNQFRRTAISAVRVGMNGYQILRNLAGSSRRTIMSADPAQITHLETAELAVGSDWASVAHQTSEWMESRAAISVGALDSAPGSCSDLFVTDETSV